MRYSFEAEPCREIVIGLMRAHLTESATFPSAAMRWLAEALQGAAFDLETRDPKHAELLESATRHMLALVERQRERDTAHYEHVDSLPPEER